MIRALHRAGATPAGPTAVTFGGQRWSVRRGRACLLVLAPVEGASPLEALRRNAGLADGGPTYAACRELGLVRRLRLGRATLVRAESVREALEQLTATSPPPGGEIGHAEPAFPLMPAAPFAPEVEESLAWLSLLRDGGPDSRVRPVLQGPDLRWLAFVGRRELAVRPGELSGQARRAGGLLTAASASGAALRVLRQSLGDRPSERSVRGVAVNPTPTATKEHRA